MHLLHVVNWPFSSKFIIVFVYIFFIYYPLTQCSWSKGEIDQVKSSFYYLSRSFSFPNRCYMNCAFIKLAFNISISNCREKIFCIKSTKQEEQIFLHITRNSQLSWVCMYAKKYIFCSWVSSRFEQIFKIFTGQTFSKSYFLIFLFTLS